jgi:hypothetical protein
VPRRRGRFWAIVGHACADAICLLVASTPAAADAPVKISGSKSERTAKWLSGGGIIFSSALIVSSFLVDPEKGTVYEPTLYIGVGTSIITPSLGQIYAGQYLTIGMGVRGIAAAIALFGASRQQDQACVSESTKNCPGITGTGLTIISLAAIIYIGGIAYDVRDSPLAVARYNKKLLRGASLTPTRNGVALVGYF